MKTSNNSSNGSVSLASKHHELIATIPTWLSVFSVEGLLIVVFNILSIATILLNSHLRRRIMYCIVNLAVADLIYGFFSSSYLIFNLLAFRNDLPTDSSSVSLRYIMTGAVFSVVLSLLSLALVSVERVFATFFPLRCRNTKFKYYLVAFGITWGLALLAALFYYFRKQIQEQPNLSSSLVRFLYVLSLVLIVGSYTSIYIKIKLQDRAMLQQHERGDVIQRRLKERRFAMTLFIVTGLSLITWIPYVTVRLIYSFSLPFIEIYKISPNLASFAYLMRGCNSVINPIIYVFRMKDFRKALLHLVSRCSRYRQVYPIGNDHDYDHDDNNNHNNTNNLELNQTANTSVTAPG